MIDVLIGTVPFGEFDPEPINLLRQANLDFALNPYGQRLSEDNLLSLIGETRTLVAGTEPITARVLDAAPHLQLISRVGVGLDNVDLAAARDRQISITYTPEAPAPAVADLALGLILSLLRGTHTANLLMHQGIWKRIHGKRISDVTLGVIGVGRIGKRVLRCLRALEPNRILAHDIEPSDSESEFPDVEWTTKKSVLRESDVVTLHLPLTRRTYDYISFAEMAAMPPGAMIVNTSRGQVINEKALIDNLAREHIGGAAIDVFDTEPYEGPLRDFPTCLLTSHMGSMSLDCRARMEVEATQEAIRYLRKEPLLSPVPTSEYELQIDLG